LLGHAIVRSLAGDGPMLPTLVDGLPDRAGWVFEPKWDGWRCLAVVDDRGLDLDPQDYREEPSRWSSIV
jgi:hypothetical protein